MTSTPRVSGEGAAERDALWQLRARDSSGAVALEGWFDSLALRRRTPGGELIPDTDGLIGGRYRGRLDSTGHYEPEVRPFIPDEVAEVADLSAALDDLFPPLPPIPLRPGASWQSGHVTIGRLADTVVSGRTLLHFSLDLRRSATETTPRGDTVPVAMAQTTTEQGTVLWDPQIGLVGRQREILVETSIPAAGRIRAPVRSRVAQHVTLTRLPPAACS
ncbi:MAG TPA: hypothetical protein VJQ44_12735 [Gemmatimonadales bacterium]|nr:hypothetical protein [Gemmatimonadales bacterium]